MNVNELMIGDYIRIVDDDTDRSFVSKIEAIDELDNVACKYPGDTVAYMYSSECCQPIPLTPEILEKNRFVKDKEKKTHGTTYHILIPTGYEENSYTIQITFYKKPICGVSVLLQIWGWIPPYNGGINDIHLCDAKYVHELQHALKLCGIEKEIVL